MTNPPLNVALGDRSYDIHVGPDLIANAGAFCKPYLKRLRVGVVTDETVAGLYLEPLASALAEEGIETLPIALPPGESTKSVANFELVVETLLEARFNRDDVIIALGGGVIGDLAGYAAAAINRGIDFIQIPTSLLAQVDSSVGGKTGVNSRYGKNLIGAFHQPRLVLADIDVLSTLSERELLAGYAEVLKYGALGDAEFFGWLESNGPALKSGDDAARIHAVRHSCRMKADIVARDEKERGERALLNLGHTFGHALEAATGYSERLLHGEGVAIGMGLAADLSARLGLCSQETPSRVRAHLQQMGMKARLKDIPGELPDAEALVGLMGRDKKVDAGQIVFILLRDIGDAFVARDVDPDDAKAVLEEALAER